MAMVDPHFPNFATIFYKFYISIITRAIKTQFFVIEKHAILIVWILFKINYRKLGDFAYNMKNLQINGCKIQV